MRNKIFGILTITLLAGVFFFSNPHLAIAEDPITYNPGWKVQVIPVDNNFRILETPPNTVVAQFTIAKPDYSLADYLDLSKDAPSLDYVLWKGEAFLKAEEAGYYVFSIISQYKRILSPNLSKAIYVEGQPIASGMDDALMGAVELEPEGLYKIEFRISGPPRKSSQIDPYFKILVKPPSGNHGIPISQILLTPAGKKK